MQMATAPLQVVIAGHVDIALLQLARCALQQPGGHVDAGNSPPRLLLAHFVRVFEPIVTVKDAAHTRARAAGAQHAAKLRLRARQRR